MKKIYTIILFALIFSQIFAQSNPADGLTEIPLAGLSTGNGHTFHLYSSNGKLNVGYSEVFIALTDKDNNFVDNFTVSDFLPLFTESSTTHSTPVGKVEKVSGKALYKTWFGFLNNGNWSLSFTYTIGSSSTQSSVISVPVNSKDNLIASSPVINKNVKSYIGKNIASYDTITQTGFFKDRDCIGSVSLPLVRSCGIGCATGGMGGCWESGLGLFIYNPLQTGTITRDSALTTSHYLLFDPESKELTRAFIESLPSAASGKISIKVTGYWSADSIPSNKTETVVPELTADSIHHKLPVFHLLSIEGINITGLTYSYTGFVTNSYKLTPLDLAPANLTAIQYSGGTKVKFKAPANVSSLKSTLKGYKVRVYDSTGRTVDNYTTTVNDPTLTSINVLGFTANKANTISVAALYPDSGVEAVSAASGGTETQTGWFKDRDCLYDSISLPLIHSCDIDCGFTSGDMDWCWNSGLGVFIYNPNQSGKISPDSSKTDTHYLLFDAQSKELFRAFLLKLPDDVDGKISVKVTGYRVEKGISANKTEWNVPELNPDSVDHYLNAFHLLSVEGTYIDGLAYSYPGFATTSYKVTPEDLAPINISSVNFTGGTKVKFTPPENARKVNSNLSGYKVRVYNSAGILQSSYTTITKDTTVTSINIPGLTANPGYYFTITALYSSSAVEVESIQSNTIETSITSVALTVNNYPTYTDDITYKARWIDSFIYNNTTYYVTLANPRSLVVGNQTVKAYINKKDSVLRPYQVVNGGFYIIQKPVMPSMGHSSSGNTQFSWNAADSVYKATIHLSMEGDWRIGLKVYDPVTSNLVAGTYIDDFGEGSTLYWDIFLGNEVIDITGIHNDILSNGVSVYPTLSQGRVTVETLSEARIQVLDFTGKLIGTYQSSGSKTIQLNVPSGLYFVTVESLGKTFVQKVIIRK